MAYQRLFWDQTNEVWIYENVTWVQWIYGAGVVPALVAAMVALCVLLFGIGRPDLAKYRKISGYLLSVILIGNGLIANLLLKGLWGRPRPTQLQQFGGVYDFEPVLTIDTLSSGKSFVCGHATMGFFFFSIALLIPKKYRVARILVMCFALGLGFLLGWVRMAQGGHFLSDVVWAGIIMWFVSLSLFHVFKLSKDLIYRPTHDFKYKVPIWALVGYAPLIALGALLGLLGTPYEYKAVIKGLDDNITTLLIDVEGDIEIKEGSVLGMKTMVQGFGVPNSSFRYHQKKHDDGSLEVITKRKGFFTELRPKLEITVPPASNLSIKILGQERDLPHTPAKYLAHEIGDN